MKTKRLSFKKNHSTSFPFTLDPQVLFYSFSSCAKLAWNAGVQMLFYAGRSQMYSALKKHAHAFRILEFGKQIVQKG